MKTWTLLGLLLLLVTSCGEKESATEARLPAKATKEEKLTELKAKKAKEFAAQGYEDGLRSLAELKATHAELEREEMAASSGRNSSNMTALRHLEGQIAILEADLARLKVALAK